MSRRVQVTCQLRVMAICPKACKNSRGMMYRAPSSTRLRIKSTVEPTPSEAQRAAVPGRQVSLSSSLFEAHMKSVIGVRTNVSAAFQAKAKQGSKNTSQLNRPARNDQYLYGSV